MNEALRKEYEEKRCTLEDVFAAIRDGDVICTSGVICEPWEFYHRLHELLPQRRGIELLKGMQTEYPFYDIQEQGHFQVVGHMFDGPMRRVYDFGSMTHIPCNLHNFIEVYHSHKPIHKFIAMAAPMDEEGNFCVSGCVMWEQGAYEAAEEVILEINPNLPRYPGCVTVPLERVSMLYERESPIREFPIMEPDETDKKIGGYIADLVNDYDCIQLGVGGIPNAVGGAFFDKKGLGLHTELFSPIMGKLILAGVITGEAKTIDRGLHVGTFARGDAGLYKALAADKNVRFRPATYTNDPYVIRQIDNMVSINTALEIDLTGQICSESIGPRQFSGTGGASDFAYGAQHSKGGRGIIAVRSTAKGGTLSKISPILTPGAVVSISRNLADIVVTEYGVAYLRGRTVRERTENLIAVAHPDFRAELRAQARKLGYIG